ncbi:MAG: class I SAM-dependent methyltransferase [Deltaproteobacteria bacterium]|nr:class I SAM-dependent methyltransferase [Deltaproteobacteria bacterium]
MTAGKRETKAGLKAEFTAAGLTLSEDEAEKFWRLHQLLTKRNPEGDLTRIRGFYNLVYKHYIDGAMAAEFMDPQGLIMDLGSGAGFPGLPLAIRRPHWPLLLAEPRLRRLAFIEEAAALLGLDNVAVYPHKAGPGFDRAVDNLVSRDFEPMAATLLRASAWLPAGGRAFLMKGPRADQELAEAARAPHEFELENDRAYTLGPGGLKRRLLTWRKKGRPVRRRADQGPSPDQEPEKRPQAGRWPLEIASRQNPRYKGWLKLLTGRGQAKSGEALVAGAKFIREIMERRPERVLGLLARRPEEAPPRPPDLPLYLIRPEIWPDLDPGGAGPPLLIISPPELPLWSGTLGEGLTVFLPCQDPGNLGSAIRTCAALGARPVLLREAASPWHPKSLRASGPAVLEAGLEKGPGLADLAGLDLPGLFGFSPKGRNLLAASLGPRAGFVFGLEGPGLPRTWPEERLLAIPMRPGQESLGVAAALAAALGWWLARRQP